MPWFVCQNAVRVYNIFGLPGLRLVFALGNRLPSSVAAHVKYLFLSCVSCVLGEHNVSEHQAATNKSVASQFVCYFRLSVLLGRYSCLSGPLCWDRIKTGSPNMVWECPRRQWLAKHQSNCSNQKLPERFFGMLHAHMLCAIAIILMMHFSTPMTR